MRYQWRTFRSPHGGRLPVGARLEHGGEYEGVGTLTAVDHRIELVEDILEVYTIAAVTSWRIGREMRISFFVREKYEQRHTLEVLKEGDGHTYELR